MNNKIKTLANQADAWCDQHWFDHPAYDVQWEQKFAELIIRECMELGDQALQDGKWPGDVLKKHFGIKE